MNVAVPSVTITIPLEARAPRVYVDALNDSECARLADWISSRPTLARLVSLAVELEQEDGE